MDTDPSAPRPIDPPAGFTTRLGVATLAAVLLLGATGCVATGAPDGHDTEGALPLREDADRLMRAGDYESATRIYARRLESDDSPVLREKWRTARRLAAQRRAEAAVAAAARGEDATARHHLSVAEDLAPGTPAVLRAREQLEPALQEARAGRELREQGRALLHGSPEDAQDVLAEARRHDPDDPETVGLLREATLRAEAERSARSAAEAWAAGDVERTLRDLRQAQFAGRPVPAATALRVRIERDLLAAAPTATDDDLRAAGRTALDAGLSSATLRRLRSTLVSRLQARAGELVAAGRPATAAILETECLRLGASIPTPGLDAARDRAQITLAVLPFDDGTGGDVDGLRLARSLAQRLVADTGTAGHGLALRVLDVGGAGAASLAANPRALRVEGTVLSQRISSSPDAHTTRRVRYVASTRDEPNPAAEDATRALSAAQARLERVRVDLEDAERVLRELRAAPITRGQIGERSGRGRVRYETRLAGARAEVERRRRIVEQASADELAARQEVVATPPRHDVPVYGEHRLAVVEFRKSAQVTVRVRLLDGDRVLLDAPVTGSEIHDEIVAPGFAPGSVAPDADESPSDPEMARRAQEHFATVAAGQLRAASEAAAVHFLEDARAAERAGRTAAAAEAYSLYLLATPDVGSPRRADAARALREIAGVHVALRAAPGGR